MWIKVCEGVEWSWFCFLAVCCCKLTDVEQRIVAYIEGFVLSFYHVPKLTEAPLRNAEECWGILR